MSKSVKENNLLTTFSSESVILELLSWVLFQQYSNDIIYLHYSNIDVLQAIR